MFEAVASPLQLLLLQEKVVPPQAETDEVRGLGAPFSRDN
jgi:hypothetical protein